MSVQSLSEDIFLFKQKWDDPSPPAHSRWNMPCLEQRKGQNSTDKEKGRTVPISSYLRGGIEQKTSHLHWKFDQGLGQSSIPQCLAIEIEPLAGRLLGPEYQSLKTVLDDYDGQEPLTSQVKLPLQSALKSHPNGEAWMNEFRRCVTKLVELMNGRIPVGSLQALVVATPDYSISTALKRLNEIEDIPQSSEMYLDAIEILQDSEERECFVCLPPEPRRRWLQRICIVGIPCDIILIYDGAVTSSLRGNRDAKQVKYGMVFHRGSHFSNKCAAGRMVSQLAQWLTIHKKDRMTIIDTDYLSKIL